MKKKIEITKKERFRDALIKFKESSHSVEDYIDFIYISNFVLKPDAGLLWSQIEDILKEVLQ
jgi:hypothetical protein